MLHALPKFLEALGEMSPNTWRSCLHVSTSPVVREVGEVDDAIPDKGLGPIGDFPLPQDLWDSVVPEFYKDGSQGFNVGAGWGGWNMALDGAPGRGPHAFVIRARRVGLSSVYR